MLSWDFKFWQFQSSVIELSELKLWLSENYPLYFHFVVNNHNIDIVFRCVFRCSLLILQVV